MTCDSATREFGLTTRYYLDQARSISFFAMAGVKRARESGDGTQISISPYMPMFEHFRQELDEHHDRRERVIKLSRDITASSKKM